MFEEIVRIYPHIRQPPSFMMNIVKKIGLDKIEPNF
jgi:hypothetical protein